MRVYVFPADLHACGHYRLIWPAEVLRDAGHDVIIVKPAERGSKISASFDEKTGECVEVFTPKDADVLVFQRVTHTLLAKAIRKMREQGAAVVIDMDDDLSNIHPSNPAFMGMHPRNVSSGAGEHSWLAAEQACNAATLVQVSTPALLQRYARHGRGQVLRNCVPDRYLDVTHYDNDTLGYAGSFHSHGNDITTVGQAIGRLTREGSRFMTIGEAHGAMQVFGIDDPLAWIDTGPVTLEQWPEVLSVIGVGIAPLADTVFNRSKSWLKSLEMAAVGVPCVVSPRNEYRMLHRLGVGLLAERPQDWYRQLGLLVHDAPRRRDLAERGREAVRDLTIERQAYLWWDTWSAARHLADEVGPDDRAATTLLTRTTRSRTPGRSRRAR